MQAVPFRLSTHPAVRRALLPQCLAVLLAGMGLTACNSARMSQRAAFSQKMDSLRGEAAQGRIPRTRVLTVLGLSGPPTERISGGARGGYVTGSEIWRLPWGDDIVCLEHQRLSRKDIAFTRDAIDALIAGHPSPMTGGTLAASRLPEPLPWYDTLVLRDRRNRAIRTLECDYWRYRPAYRGAAIGNPDGKGQKGGMPGRDSIVKTGTLESISDEMILQRSHRSIASSTPSAAELSSRPPDHLLPEKSGPTALTEGNVIAGIHTPTPLSPDRQPFQ